MSQKSPPLPRPLLLRADGHRLLSPFEPLAPELARRLPSVGGPLELSDGDWLRWQPGASVGEGGDVEVLARGGSALAGLYDLAIDIEVSPIHPAGVFAEAAAEHASPGIDAPELEDLRRLPFITIDEPHSRDLDQALFVERRDGGHTVWYAIADASHYVRPGTTLFREALRRGSTFYMPGLVLPMLPRSLSEDLVSLNPDVDRRALVFEIGLDEHGESRSCRLIRARVRSRWKTSYDEVQSYYDGAAVDPPSDRRAIIAGLEALRQVGERRMALAELRDTIRLRRRELSVRLAGDDEPGRGFIAMADPRNDAERYNEQISLLSNVLGAQLLTAPDPNIQPIFRFHRAPDEHRLSRFSGQVRSLAKRHRLDAETWRWRRRSESLADFLARLPHDGPEGRIARAIHRQAMLAGGRAGFDTAPGIHHGVGADAYARFTAPMREIVGIFVHKEACEHLGFAVAGEHGADEALREQVVSAADRSRGLQRRLDGEVNRRLLDQLFRADVAGSDVAGFGDAASNDGGRPGTVMGVTRSKLHVQLDDPPIDVKIYLSHLEDQLGQRLQAGHDRVTIRDREGRVKWTVGQEVRVRAVDQDRERDRWRLHCLSTKP